MFDGCQSLVSIHLPYGIKSIGMWAFGNCDNLKNLAILTLELISLSAANHSNAKPATRIKMASIMVVFLFE